MYLTVIFSAINLAIASPNGFLSELSKFSEADTDLRPKTEVSNKSLRPHNTMESLPNEGILQMLQKQYPKVMSRNKVLSSPP